MAHAAVLLVDDERFARTVYADYLRGAGYEVEVAEGAESALVQLAYRRYDVLLTDVILPGSKDGLELLDSAKQLDPNIGLLPGEDPALLTPYGPDGLAADDTP